MIRGYNQELAQTHLRAAVWRPTSTRRTCSSGSAARALDLLASLVRSGIRKHSVEQPAGRGGAGHRRCWPTCWKGCTRDTGSCVGIPGLAAGQYIEIRGVGKRFSGTYRVRKVTHRIDGSGFRTDFSISRAATPACWACCASSSCEKPSPERSENVLRRGRRRGARQPRARGGTPPKLRWAGCKVAVPRPVRRRRQRTGRRAPARWRGDGQGLLRPAGEGRPGAGRVRERRTVAKPYVLGSLWHAKAPPAGAATPTGQQHAADDQDARPATPSPSTTAPRRSRLAVTEGPASGSSITHGLHERGRSRSAPSGPDHHRERRHHARRRAATVDARRRRGLDTRRIVEHR